MRLYMAILMPSLASSRMGCIILICEGEAGVGERHSQNLEHVLVSYLLLLEVDLVEDLVHAFDRVYSYFLDLVIEHIHQILQRTRGQVT